ncbi:MAG: DUF4263 domain-containing protein [Planctomycetota bacterium]|nr:DUF4263 domain-containing protein [Planctomycetota bacterium]MDA1213365.1 DUF4263 domain-containing protein [Planctomycetota bacterium]
MFHAALKNVLDTKSGERAACTYLRDNAEIVHCALCPQSGHFNYVLYEFPFGAQHKADFVVLTSNSRGWDVNFVECEPVDAKVITKKRKPADRLVGAISQTKDWGRYISLNNGTVRRDLADWCKSRDKLLYHTPGTEPTSYTGHELRDPETYIEAPSKPLKNSE